MKKWNHYKCPECEGITVARHDKEQPYLEREWLADHFRKGGAFMREV